MLIIMIILIILAVIIAKIAFKKEKDTILALCLIGSVSIGIASLLLIGYSIEGYIRGYTASEKLSMYQEENKAIENQITTIVNNYQGYEKEIISNVADMEVSFIKIPELKSNELVQTQIYIYQENNEKIKELKEAQINLKLFKWLLYFGK